MGQIWDSTPTRTTGKHRAHLTPRQRINRLGLIRLAIAAAVLATVMGLTAAAPVALLDIVLASVAVGVPVAITHGLVRGIDRLAAGR